MDITMKLCNFRDCTNGEHEASPNDKLDPCRVFRNAENGRWYNELTGESVRLLKKKDGTMFDAHQWLELQMGKAARQWNRESYVHEVYTTITLQHRPAKPAARAPENTNRELDIAANMFIRDKSGAQRLRSEYYEAGQELHGLTGMQKQWGSHPSMQARILELREHRTVLRKLQIGMEENQEIALPHLRNDNKWNNKWRVKHGKLKEFVLMAEHNKQLFIIDRNGLKSAGRYLYLPDADNNMFASIRHAHVQYGVPRVRWENMELPGESIGQPIRSKGKKNANGARLTARIEHTRYATLVIDLVKSLRSMNVSLFKVRDNDELYKYYLENIAPKLAR